MRIDAHQHFWIYNTNQQLWINDKMKAIRRDFLPIHLAPILKSNNIDGCVSVQAASEQETFFLLYLAERNPHIIKGVVGWIDLLSENLEERLSYFDKSPLLKGFRHIIQAEPQDDFILRKDFAKGIRILEKHNFIYDILIYEKHLPYTLEFIKKFPAHRFVINHLGKPDIKNKSFEQWATLTKKISMHKNVYCKISGLVTQHNYKHWKIEDFKPYIHHIVECFGSDRIMFGSDWPVCLVAATYKQVIHILEEATHTLSPLEKQKLWGLNATTFYNL